MARRRRSPEHDITGESLFVPDDDSAWDHERIASEIAELRKDTPFAKKEAFEPSHFHMIGLGKHADDPALEHPFVRYQKGLTRFDLEAEGIRDYLDEKKAPEKWRLRRLPWRVRQLVFRLLNEHGDWMPIAWLTGTQGLENGDAELATMLGARETKQTKKGKPPVDGDDLVEAAVKLVGYDAIESVASAVLRLSQDLSEEEKKA